MVVVKLMIEKLLITILSKKFLGVSAVNTPTGKVSHLKEDDILSPFCPGTADLLGKNQIRKGSPLPHLIF